MQKAHMLLTGTIINTTAKSNGLVQNDDRDDQNRLQLKSFWLTFKISVKTQTCKKQLYQTNQRKTHSIVVHS